MKLLIYQYPIVPQFSEKAVSDLVSRNESELAYEFALEKYQRSPDAFSSKWLGIISLSKENVEEAEKYLLKSMDYNATDEQVLYNLAGVYVKKQNYSKALEYVTKAVEINPNYKAAVNLKQQLENAVN